MLYGIFIASVSLLAAPQEVLAQDDGADARLEEVVVTARRRVESLQTVPIAVTSISGDELVEIGASDISEIQSRVPNLSIYPGRNQSTTLTAFVRGIGQADPLWGVDPGVGMYLDDVYIARPQGALLDIFDVERIEVLRGPQGTLYGKNTIGGAIKYVSAPLTDDFTGYVGATFGDYGTQDFKASIGGALIDGVLRAKVAAASMTHDGYGKNLVTGAEMSAKDTRAVRVALDWLPTDNLTFKLAYDNTRDDGTPKGYQRLVANPLCPAYGITCEPLSNPFDVENGMEPVNGTDSEGMSLMVQWDINDAWTFKSITADRESDTDNTIDFDTSQAPIVDVYATYYDEQFTQELQVLYDGGGKLAGVVGFYYLDGEAGGLVQNIFLGSIFGTTDGRTETESTAIYTDWSYNFTERLRLHAGVRVTSEDKRGIAFNAGYSDATFTEVTAVTADYDQTATFDSTSPKIGLDFQISDDIMLYGHVSRGFKSGGFNVRAQSSIFPESAEPFDDEELTNIALGMKSTFADGQFKLNTEIFSGDYTDVQVSTFTDYDSTGDGVNDAFFGNFLNAGDATVEGIEVEFWYAPDSVEWLRLSGNVNYLDASPNGFLDLNDNGVVDTQVITNAPKNTYAIRADVNFPVGNGSIVGNIGYAYRDDSTLTNEGEGTEPLVQESFGVFNASIGYMTDQYSIIVHGKNLGDEEYLTNGYNIPALGIVTGSNGAPRTILATFTYNF